MDSIAMKAFTREFEREADHLGLKLAAHAGFDPLAFERYVERTQVDPKSKILSTLPARDRRLIGIEQTIALLPVRSYRPGNPENFEKLQRELR